MDEKKPLGSRGPVNHGDEMKLAEEDAAFREADEDRFTDEQRAAALATAHAYIEKHGDPNAFSDDVDKGPHPSPHAARDKTEEYDMREGSDPDPTEVELATRSQRWFGDDADYDKTEEPKRIMHTPDGRGCVQEGFPTGQEPNPFDDPATWSLPSSPPVMPPELPMPSPEAMEKLKDTIEKMGQGQDGGGYRMNAGKNRIELLPEIWIWALADVMTQGARKYPARNWEKGMDWSAMVGCMYRHLAKFQSGQRYDGKEFNKKLGTTGCHELAMIAWNALALMFYDIYGLGENDLPVYEDLDHFIRVNGSGSDLAIRWAKEDSDGDV